ncbi:MAG: aldehyde dehydrogenase [Oscillospiraceae bacterium]|nr:aldehyde dehydrogenase [Oscillospiraceae bacterium]
MDKSEISKIVATQREYFKAGKTLDVSVRISALKALKNSIKRHEPDINQALEMDLGKGAFESYMCETGMVLSELSHMLSHIKSYAKEKTVATPLAQFHARSYKKPSPYGVTLIMSPWNYPFLLTISPLIDSIAAGNTAVVKPSAYSPYTSEVIKTILKEAFNEEYVAVVTGGRAENTSLLEEHFDYIFFTGSQAVGRDVMRHASEHLTPVTLELGGKSPCIVDKTANIRLAAKRIVFGKYLNCGQTCVAPDYIYCDASIKDKLMDELRAQIRKQFGTSPLLNHDYGKIINEKHFNRLTGLMDMEKVAIGGRSDPEALRIEPTVMDNVTFDDPVMQEEIFGPVLPVLTYESLDEAISEINDLPHPLALYLFTTNKKNARKVTSSIGYGGGCINDTIIHLATTEMGFGGFGESGMGSYHGKTGFDTFTHYKSIVDKKQWIDLPMRYQPYKKVYEKMVRMFMR